VIFVPKYVSRVVFNGGILGGVRQYWGNPYLNSTTVLFDIITFECKVDSLLVAFAMIFFTSIKI